VDLHALLPPETFISSFAAGIDAAGNVYGTAYTADLVPHAIVWTVVPEPSAVGVLALAAATGLLRRRSW
jgi:hypothetical protein